MALLFLLAALGLGQVAGQLAAFSVKPRVSGTNCVDGDVPNEIRIIVQPNAGNSLAADGDKLTITIGGGGQKLFAGGADVDSFTVTVTQQSTAPDATATWSDSTRILTVSFPTASTPGNGLPDSGPTSILLTSPLDIGGNPVSFQAVDTTPYTFDPVTSDIGGSVYDTGPQSVFTASSGGGVSGDPITFWNGRKTKFWLPMHSKVPLLETPLFVLWATALQGPTEDLQWFQSFMVTLPNHELVAQVDLDHTGLRQLDVNIRQGKGMAPLQGGGVQLVGSTLRLALSEVKLQNNRVKGAKTTEYFFVESPEISFAIFSSYAGTEFPNDEQLQQKYQHLNFLPMDIDDHSKFTGALPQMWGLVPMEADTAAMLVPPSQVRELAEPGSCSPGAVKACMEAM